MFKWASGGILPASPDFVQNDHMGKLNRCAQTTLLSLCMIASGCDQQIGTPNSKDAAFQPLPWNSGKLLAVVPEPSQGPVAEFEVELARLFADQLHLHLATLALPLDQVVSALRNHQAHLAAVPLRARNNPAEIKFGPSYQSVRELLVCNGKRPRITGLATLIGSKLVAAAGSTHEAALTEARQRLPALHWESDRDHATTELLSRVDTGNFDCVAADELQFEDAIDSYPNLTAELEIASPSQLAWGFPDDADPHLLEQARIFFNTIEHNGTLQRLLESHFGRSDGLLQTKAAAFVAGINTILPRFRGMFEQAAIRTGEDWRLLAALAYQESRWNPIATSVTNVRGMMMLTGDTADLMNVVNRLDARESIIAGAAYLEMLKKQLPEHIPEPDRTWMALAAYNQGSSHLEDARRLTKRDGLNPDSWSDVKGRLLRLNAPEYYKKIKHGYADGRQAVNMVENIRSYYKILKRMQPDQLSSLADDVSYRLFEPKQGLLP
jgi:membrane-bound lytic murein transglycosylase F